MPNDAALLAARLARMQVLIDELEQACAESAEQREVFARLHAEIQAARAAIKPFKKS